MNHINTAPVKTIDSTYSPKTLRVTISAGWYYHIELPRHGVIFAEAAPVESLLDTGHRGVFDNAEETVITLPEAMQERREAESCAPLCTAGPVLEAIRQRIAGRMVGGRLSR